MVVQNYLFEITSLKSPSQHALNVIRQALRRRKGGVSPLTARQLIFYLLSIIGYDRVDDIAFDIGVGLDLNLSFGFKFRADSRLKNKRVKISGCHFICTTSFTGQRTKTPSLQVPRFYVNQRTVFLGEGIMLASVGAA